MSLYIWLNIDKISCSVQKAIIINCPTAKIQAGEKGGTDYELIAYCNKNKQVLGACKKKNSGRTLVQSCRFDADKHVLLMKVCLHMYVHVYNVILILKLIVPLYL